MPAEQSIPPAIRKKLNALRRLLLAHLVGKGLAWVAIALVAGVFLSLGVEYKLHMDRAQRLLILGAVLGGVGYACWRLLLRPLRVPMGPEEMALVLERHFPHLDDRLISALQFVRLDPALTGSSPALMREVSRQAQELSAGLAVSKPIQGNRTWRRIGLAAGALAVLAIFTAFNYPVMAMWFQRSVLLSDVAWPKKTHLFLDQDSFRVRRADRMEVVKLSPSGQLRIGRGDDLEAVVHADPDYVLPEEVICHSRMPALGALSQAVGPDETLSGYAISFPNAAADFEFYFTGNDDRTQTVQVVVVPPPELTAVAFTVKPPEYTGLPQSDLGAANGVMTVSAGSTVIVRSALANKELAQARLMLDGRNVCDLTLKSVQVDGQGRLMGMEGKFTLPDRLEKNSLPLEFQLSDQEGFVSKGGSALYTLRIEPDRAPTVALGRSGVRGDISAHCIIPLLLEVHDDHGLSAAQLSVSVATPEGLTSTAPASQPDSQPASQPTSQPAGVDIPFENLPPLQKEVKLQPRLMLSKMAWFSTSPELQKITDYQWRPGQIVTLQASVLDNLPGSFGGPNQAQSSPLSFKIVSDQELLTELIRRQKELRADFLGCINVQTGVHARLSDLDLSAPEANDKLSSSLDDQRRVAQQTAIVVQQYRTVMEEMENNQVGERDHRAVLTTVIIALGNLSEKSLPEAAAVVERASKNKTPESLADAAAAADRVLQEMNSVLDMMIKGQDLQDSINALNIIMEWTQKQKQDIQDQVRKELGNFLKSGPSTRPG
jgi:hypothetical protein